MANLKDSVIDGELEVYASIVTESMTTDSEELATSEKTDIILAINELHSYVQ